MSDKYIDNNIKKIAAVLKFILLIVIVAGIPAYLYFFQRDFLASFKSFDDIIAFLREYKTYSAFIFIGAQIVQIMISVLPGQVFQFAAGYLYGFFPGLALAIIGATLGTTITYFLARVLGKDAIHMLIGEEKAEYYVTRLNSKKAYMITLIIYLIPGFPKDMVSYVAGISDMKFIPFLLISLIGRLPAMAGSIIFGSFYMKGNYTGMVIVGVIAVSLFLICIIKRKEVMGLADRFYDKYNKDQKE